MRSKPFFSIIIPVHNSSSHINDISRVLARQAFRNFEAIIIDDGSLDSTYKDAKKIASDNVIVLKQKQSGVSAARNFGMSKAKGEYLVFLDDDDELHSDALGVLYENITKNNYPDIVRYSGIRRGFNGKKESIKGFVTLDYLEEIMNPEKKVNCYCWLISVKNENIVPFNKNLKYMEDDLFYIENFHKKKKVICIDDELYTYNYNPNSKTKNVANFRDNINDILIASKTIKKVSFLTKKQKCYADYNAINMVYWRLKDCKRVGTDEYKSNLKFARSALRQNRVSAIWAPSKVLARYIFILVGLII